ncbi:MAG: 16S rRNA (guanine(966)-N(2))-methyltransferase RsmD [Kiritimatiellia bacterium]
MRITGGEFCGRKLAVPRGDGVRPTQDRVREALFSILMDVIPGTVFIDLFAGSGAVGLEAFSRGAASIIWIENSSRHLRILRQNCGALMPGRGEIVMADVESWVKTGGKGRKADVIFADPPYVDALQKGFSPLMKLLAEYRVVSDNGFFVAEMPVRCDADEETGWTLQKDRVYGHTRVAVYRRSVERKVL